MEKILKLTPKSRQTAFFSATFPRSIESLSRTYQNHAVHVTVKSAKAEAPDIREVIYEAEYEDKPKALLWLLQQYKPESAIVFCNQKATISDVTRQVVMAGVSADCLHGDLEQFERDRVLAKFRNHSTRVLIATDVAARGLDIESLDAVINLDLPPQPEIYVHRIGRTGRAGKKGLALSLCAPREKHKAQAIESFTGKAIPRRTLGSGQLGLVASTTERHREAKMETLRISGGRKEKMRPGDILGALTGEAGGLEAKDVGKIEIHDHFSYVAVSKTIANTALRRLQEGRIKGRRFLISLVK